MTMHDGCLKCFCQLWGNMETDYRNISNIYSFYANNCCNNNFNILKIRLTSLVSGVLPSFLMTLLRSATVWTTLLIFTSNLLPLDMTSGWHSFMTVLALSGVNNSTSMSVVAEKCIDKGNLGEVTLRICFEKSNGFFKLDTFFIFIFWNITMSRCYFIGTPYAIVI